MHTFPFAAVVREYRRVGKHFVAPELLAALDRVRATLPTGADTTLARFLDVALDKHDGRYDNPSYIALSLLPSPRTREERDRVIALLVTDTLRFELERRPDARVTAKRCRLGLRALGVDAGRDPLGAAHEACRDVAPSDDEALMLQLTALPVSTIHDEYMFIRMLQSFEMTFALMAANLVSAIEHADAACVDAAERALRDVAPLWSFVATIDPAAFLAFREFTEGASAIQSRNYKLVESLCRRPDAERLDSPAYESVPEVRDRVRAGQRTLADARPSPVLAAAMARFEAALLKWRNSHFRLAMKMLGSRPGTGYTEGVPYLDRVRGIPVFSA